jgi:hypothetical protein
LFGCQSAVRLLIFETEEIAYIFNVSKGVFTQDPSMEAVQILATAVGCYAVPLFLLNEASFRTGNVGTEIKYIL